MRKSFYTFLAVFLFSFFAVFAGQASASSASLYFSPSAKTVSVGDSFSIAVYVSSLDQPINAASGVISFPQDKVQVSSISKTGSIFSLWAQEPVFSNDDGTINFEGVVLNPGFSGSAGKVITINFKAKTIGSDSISFSSGSVLANDGKGTNILEDLGSADLNIKAIISAPATEETLTTQQEEQVIISTAESIPSAPIISSSTHPDQNKWYSQNNPVFSWEITSDITSVKIKYDKKPSSLPTILYKTPISEKQLNDISDGIWYFHAQLCNKYGCGKTSHYRFKIDTEKPKPLLIEFIDGLETTNPKPTVVFNTTDDLSGIDYYQIKIGEGSPFILSASSTVKSNPFTLPLQDLGQHIILVEAFDEAGNYISDYKKFIIEPLSSPIITEYPKNLKSGEALIIKGTSSYPEAQINVWLLKDKTEVVKQSITSDQNGNFIFTPEKNLEPGLYKLVATVSNERGEKSSLSDEILINVEQSAIIRLGSITVKSLAITAAVILFIIFVIFIICYSYRKISGLKRKFKKKINDTEESIHEEFGSLKEELMDQIKVLEKVKKCQEISEEEGIILKRLKKNIDDVEKRIKKEIIEIEDK
ncbi:MAG: cohesin domain-containing protein [Candidatus Pacebacteria bacterium]|nr:cohesin domain-containing protein [Candidatus Paceibacterota bacterium]